MCLCPSATRGTFPPPPMYPAPPCFSVEIAAMDTLAGRVQMWEIETTKGSSDKK